ncbi:hypothetical protein PRIPAC_71398 [Pristionchus pacificus]|uniref:Uncharacterized protein n=1 Tax=Pristionchus pacificus TaxID=54126 RepID=A0A2A6BGJ9_PRIPA|nr:hypothetical protein PRIPAC_71398 [Pristionchus pacificus]|eukprot:PDM65014.1 hypothetical protein PRIPAC_53270 [Pristionchus pacificus]
MIIPSVLDAAVDESPPDVDASLEPPVDPKRIITCSNERPSVLDADVDVSPPVEPPVDPSQYSDASHHNMIIPSVLDAAVDVSPPDVDASLEPPVDPKRIITCSNEMLDAAADVLSTGSVVEPSVDPPVVEPSVDPEKGDLFVNRWSKHPSSFLHLESLIRRYFLRSLFPPMILYTIFGNKFLIDAHKPPVEEASAVVLPSVEEAPVDEASVEEPPVDDSAVEEAPVEDSAVDEAPVDDSAVDEAPVDDSAVDEAPVEDSAVEDAPVELSAVDEAPVDDSAVDEAPYVKYLLTALPVELMTVDEEASVDDEKVKVDEASVVEEAPDEDPTRSNIQLVKPTKIVVRLQNLPASTPLQSGETTSKNAHIKRMADRSPDSPDQFVPKEGEL